MDYDVLKAFTNNEIEPYCKNIEMWQCITALGIKPFKDGNQWCFLYGDNIQEGICGFGDTIDEAAWDFYTDLKSMKLSIEQKITLLVEQKAKRYDEALEWMRGVYPTMEGAVKEDAGHYFPELKESEDERLKKELIELKETLCDKCRKAHSSYSCQDITALGRCYIEAINTSSNKVESKFHKSDFIKHNKVNIICKVISVNSGSYYVENIETSHRIELFNAEQDFHLWTIQDAKDGDVLAFYGDYRGNKMVQVGIIEKYVGKHGGCSNTFKTYVGVNWENNLQIGEYMGCSDIRPATKEQWGFLFQKMKEAGYEWDAEKKELKKIEQKTVWSEEDEHKAEDTIYFLDTAKKHYASTVELDACIDWLKSLKQRIGG